MTDIFNQNNILGRNIRHLRKLYGETQTELGEAIGFSKSAIGYYESGDEQHHPDYETIMLIAKHYGIPVETLLHTDLTAMMIGGFPFKSLKEMAYFMNSAFPLVESESAMLNPHFNKGYIKSKELLIASSKGIPTSTSSFEIIKELFSLATEETNYVEAMVNELWCIWQVWFAIESVDFAHLFPSIFSQGKEKLSKEKRTQERLLLDIKANRSSETLKLRREFIENTNDCFNELIRKIKTDPNWFELADYYMALRYFYSYTDSGESDEMNQQIGIHMLYSLVEIKNKYAIRFLTAIFNPDVFFSALR